MNNKTQVKQNSKKETQGKQAQLQQNSRKTRLKKNKTQE